MGVPVDKYISYGSGKPAKSSPKGAWAAMMTMEARAEEATRAMNLTLPVFLKPPDEISGLNILGSDAFRSQNNQDSRESRDIYEILADKNRS